MDTTKMSQIERMHSGKGFIAALDQSGGSTPKALAQYGIPETSFANEEEMYNLVHEMRTRIIECSTFNHDYILAAILFENTINRKIDGQWTADYLWEKKNIIPILKVDKGLDNLDNGVQLMKPIVNLDQLLLSALEKNVFGTKMRSVIKEANETGIAQVVEQQFAISKQIMQKGLIPIIEPEIDIYSVDKQKSEVILKEKIIEQLNALDKEEKVILKLSIPTENNFYSDLMANSHVLRVVALSGGYSREEATAKLAQNHGLIASFSRALSEGLSAEQSDAEFNATLSKSIKKIYEASIT